MLPTRLTFRLPRESTKLSSPRSTRSIILSTCTIEILARSCAVEKLSLDEQLGNLRTDSMFQGPNGSSS